MGIVNRTMDASQQREVFTEQVSGQIAGATVSLAVIPFPCVLDSVQLASIGPVSAIVRLDVHRFIAGAGITQILGVGISTILASYGTSGLQSVSLLPPGSTGLMLQTGDMLALTSGISAYVGYLVADVVVKKTQDRVAFFGNST